MYSHACIRRDSNGDFEVKIMGEETESFLTLEAAFLDLEEKYFELILLSNTNDIYSEEWWFKKKLL